MLCTCDCIGVVTEAEIKAIDKKCGAAAQQKFVATGGSLDEWEVTKQDAQADAGVAMMETCYTQEFEAQGYQDYGTAAQQEAIHSKCDETAKQEYMK